MANYIHFKTPQKTDTNKLLQALNDCRISTDGQNHKALPGIGTPSQAQMLQEKLSRLGISSETGTIEMTDHIAQAIIRDSDDAGVTQQQALQYLVTQGYTEQQAQSLIEQTLNPRDQAIIEAEAVPLEGADRNSGT